MKPTSVKTKWATFIELSELPTFTGNIFLILIGVTFSYKLTQEFYWIHTLVYTFAIFCFHLFVNSYSKLNDPFQISDEQNNQRDDSTIDNYTLSLSLVKTTCLLSLLFFFLTSAYFMMFSTPWVIFIGVIGFLISFFYFSGPLPFNATALGEMIGAVAMGFLVPLGALLVNQDELNLISFPTMVTFFCICLVPILTIFNCLLAKNICDSQKGIAHKRKTLVYFIGRKSAIATFKLTILLIFIIPAIFVILHWFQWPSLLFILYLPFVWKRMQPYFKCQNKKTTFSYAIRFMEQTLNLYSTLYFISIFLT